MLGKKKNKGLLSEKMGAAEFQHKETVVPEKNTQKSLCHKKRKSRYQISEAKAKLSENISSPNIETEESIHALEEDLNANADIELHRAERAERNRKIKKKIQIGILAFACCYLVFLIYGVIQTKYIYDKDGVVVPQRMTVESIKAQKEFDEMAAQYRQARVLYEKTLMLDYRIGAGIEDPSLIAPEYDTLLDKDVQDLVIQLNSLTPSAAYTQYMEKLRYWTGTDLAVYCQSISKAIQQNDVEAQNKALAFRDSMYNDFSDLTKMLLTLSERIEGTDVSDIYEWSPEKYITEEAGGLRDGQ